MALCVCGCEIFNKIKFLFLLIKTQSPTANVKECMNVPHSNVYDETFKAPVFLLYKLLK